MASSTINPSYGPITSTGTITSWLPLNTAWSAPAECSTLFLSDVLSPHQLYLNDPKYPNVVVGAPACLPPQISTWWYNTVSSLAPTEYSLGGYSFVCPSAYSTVFSTANSLTTTIGCCPSDYNWLSTLLPAGSVPQCNSILAPGNITFAQTNTGANNFNDGFTLATSSLSTTFTVRGVQVNGYIFSGAATTSSTTISSSFASTTTSSSFASITNGSTTSLSTDTTSPAVNKSLGLSEGAKIGVGVGVALVVIICAALLATLLLFSRKRRQSNRTTQYFKPELDGTSLQSTRIHGWDPEIIRYELDSETTRHEMHSEIPSHEMGASPNDRAPAAEIGGDCKD